MAPLHEIAASALPKSLLDTDLYKCTMQRAILETFPDVEASYRLTLRDESLQFTLDAVDTFKASIKLFPQLKLTDEEFIWLRDHCPQYFDAKYLEYLKEYSFKPEQVDVQFENGKVIVDVHGPEVYFQTMDTDWDYSGQVELAYTKAKELISAGCAVSEFGTRRRRTYHAQDLVMQGLSDANRTVSGRGKISGTSNLHFAMKYSMRPIGTIAHEWFMGIATLRGYEHANMHALDQWEKIFPSGILLALTDTFTTDVFLRDFTHDPKRVAKWTGLRQDSGDPYAWTKQIVEMYKSFGIQPSSKIIIYSDGLNVEQAVELQKNADTLDITCSFGIGTSLTNDFKTKSTGEKSKAMNMVIKLNSVNGKPCVKISDNLSKNTGDPQTVKEVKEFYGLPA